MRDWILELASTLEFEINIRKRNLKRSNHYTKVEKKVIDGVLHYVLFKSKKPTQARFFPIFGRMQI